MLLSKRNYIQAKTKKTCHGRLLLHTTIIILLLLPLGSDGHSYMFLLKGHEDLRQDERVMQLFGLVNTLLDNNPETFKRHLRQVVCACV